MCKKNKKKRKRKKKKKVLLLHQIKWRQAKEVMVHAAVAAVMGGWQWALVETGL